MYRNVLPNSEGCRASSVNRSHKTHPAGQESAFSATIAGPRTFLARRWAARTSTTEVRVRVLGFAGCYRVAGLYASKILVAEFIGRSLTKETGAMSLLGVPRAFQDPFGCASEWSALKRE